MSHLDGCPDGCDLREDTLEVPTAGVLFGNDTAHARRKAREVARIAMLCDEGSLHVPESAEEIRGLWEQAVCGEPHWSADFPSSAIRTGIATVRSPWPERALLHKCMEPDEVPVWLNRLINLLWDERLAPELRAACGLGLLDWIHPFGDGNGHTGRLLMLATLNARYSQLTLVCLAYELVINRPQPFNSSSSCANAITMLSVFVLACFVR